MPVKTFLATLRCTSSFRWQKRSMADKMLSADLLVWVLRCGRRYRAGVAVSSSLVEQCAPRLIRYSVSRAKKRSTWLSHDGEADRRAAAGAYRF